MPWALLAGATLAAAAPTLLAHHTSPSPTFYNQALALGLWALWVVVSVGVTAWVQQAQRQPGGADAQPGPRTGRAAGSGLKAALLALALLAGAVLWSWGPGGLPRSLALSGLGMLGAAALLLAAGAAAGAQARHNAYAAHQPLAAPPFNPGQPVAVAVFIAFCWAYAFAGVLNAAVGMVQVFAPGWTDVDWLSATSIAGRAVGNLRQPNHLSSVLMWGCIAVVGLLELRRLALHGAALLLTLLLAAVVLTASRTGLVSVLLLAVWALLDKRLQPRTRWLLLSAPLIYGAVWWGVAQWAVATAHTFGGAARLAETDISSSRFGIWANTLQLIAQQPWAGVGWGEFNYAWTLTPFPGRPVAFFDHTHNLPLQLLVELGLPLGGTVLALLLWALWRAAAQAWSAPEYQHGQGSPRSQAHADVNVAQRCAVMVVLMIGLHSLLEYPLWYAYFLLPTAWAWGFALGAGKFGAGAFGAGSSITPSTQTIASPRERMAQTAQMTQKPQPSPYASPALLVGALLLMLGTVYAVVDYRQVASIFVVQPGAAPLEQRVARGQQSPFFGHHADYAAATAGVRVPDRQAAFDRATHFLLDTRLMKAWADALAAAGREDEARHLAARLREFRKPQAADVRDYFAVCDGPAPAASAVQFRCLPPQAAVHWRRYLPAR